jgi:dTDP-4-dehydrorhamnose reductase
MGGCQRLLITGGAGLLAWCWASTRDSHNDIVLLQHRRPITHKRWHVDCQALEDSDALAYYLEKKRIDICVHTAGLTNVEFCETKPSLAHAINAKLPGSVARACSRVGCKLIHISTDHLFADQDNPYSEDAVSTPLNVYAQSKRAGEESVIEANPSALVIRTNFYGYGLPYRPSFSDRILAALRAGEVLHLFSDVWFTPILAAKLAEIAHALQRKDCAGIFHVGADDCISKYHFGLLIAGHFGLDSTLIEPISISDRPNLVRRPKQMGLSNLKVSQALGQSIGKVNDHIALLRLQNSSSFVD